MPRGSDRPSHLRSETSNGCPQDAASAAEASRRMTIFLVSIIYLSFNQFTSISSDQEVLNSFEQCSLLMPSA